MSWKIVSVLLTFVYLPFAFSKEVRILSLDGGGIRGVASLEILKNLEINTGASFHEDFEIFAGTSTGSIIAVTLAMGIPVQEMITNYIHLSSKVFGDETTFSLFSPKYDQHTLKKNLLKIFASRGYTKETTLGELPKKIVIPTVCLDDPETNRWSMKVIENITAEGKNIRVIDAILESTAAPTYFPSYKHSVDGGIAAAAPSLTAYTYAYHPYNIHDQGVVLLSIGTGYIPRHIKGEEDWGTAKWISPVSNSGKNGSLPILSMISDVEGQVPEQLLSVLIPDSYRKINFALKKEIDLDDYKDMKELIKEADAFVSSNPTIWQETCSWLKNSL
ncbi:MAG: patatin-like phospholipase family protein [Simkaniaceae bacterium]|nr:MAG: patatin-like phospholipase family protein [Simkaniaceae bacterium]